MRTAVAALAAAKLAAAKLAAAAETWAVQEVACSWARAVVSSAKRDMAVAPRAVSTGYILLESAAVAIADLQVVDTPAAVAVTAAVLVRVEVTARARQSGTWARGAKVGSRTVERRGRGEGGGGLYFDRKV